MKSPPPEIDKHEQYGNYQRAKDWRDTLWKNVCHKSLDIAEEDMGDLNAPKTTTIQNGIGWRELATAGALGLGGWWLAAGGPPTADRPLPTSTTHDIQQSTRTTEVQELELRFFQRLPDGSFRPIDLQPLPSSHEVDSRPLESPHP